MRRTPRRGPRASVEHPRDSAALELSHVTKHYQSGAERTTSLDDISARFPVRSFTAIMGPSGSGKTTFLQCAAGLDTVDDGMIRIGEHNITGLSRRDLTVLRRSSLGFIFQSYNLIPTLTVRQNVGLPAQLDGVQLDGDHVRAVLRTLGIADLESRLPAELSGGQQQRTAIARSLVMRPTILFADEPTGALDSHASRQVLACLRDAADQHGQTIIMVTHDAVAASHSDRVMLLKDGRFVDELSRSSAQVIAERMTALERD
jgi:putative ABC transport system ATP-binding protein